MDQQKGCPGDGDEGEKLDHIADQTGLGATIESATKVDGRPAWLLTKGGGVYINSAYVADSACSGVLKRPFSGLKAAIRNLIARLRCHTLGQG
jgi:hypothetical protein